MSEPRVNFMGGSPLNRLSWLRPSHDFLNALVALPQTRWILFKNGLPLVGKKDGSRPSVAYLSTNQIKPLLGPEPFFGQGLEAGKRLLPEHASSDNVAAARHLNSPVVFLGLHENETTGALPSSDFINAEAAVKNIEGTPYFSLDVAQGNHSDAELESFLTGTDVATNGTSLSFTEPRAFMTTLDGFTAGVFAGARSLVDWNSRNKFCPACGSPTYSMWGGWKISCSTLLPWAPKSDKPCPTAKGLHNFTHPRTDPVVIMIAIDETGDKVLLGRNKKFPGKFYSALAGFMEPGETFEDAVLREMWEEAGVKVWNVKYHSGQPWPFPANLMVGFYARADSSQPIRVDLDNELEDAQWFTRAEVLDVLNHPEGTTLSGREHKVLNDNVDGTNTAEGTEIQKPDVPPFRVPPMTAIAGVLIRDWAEGKIGFESKQNNLKL
ncbi:NAD+ diphosphatase [Hymenopellis radicata]|nr:NAD+ diphosphatase [Hymenopellis radicata]